VTEKETKLSRRNSYWIIALLALAVGGVLAFKQTAGKPGRDQVSATGDAARSLPRLVDLGADKCIPCKMMAPVLEQLRGEFSGRLEVVFIDVWKDQSAGSRYGIRVIPTQIFFDASGRELSRHEGFMSREDILSRWRELGIEL
jgi:thioredoxin 1